MGGLKPVEKENDTVEVTGEFDGGDERVTFGVIDGMAYVIYADGRVDVGADGKAVRMPKELAQKIADDYDEYIR